VRLYYTPRSHFSRKVRILLDAWDVAVEQVNVGNVADAQPEQFGAHPLMRVPALLDGEQWVFESDHIAAYLMRRFDPADRFAVGSTDVDTLNARAVMNGIMAAEVELILAERTGIDVRAHARFDKLRQSITQGLGWLSDHAALFGKSPSYAGFHLVCLWDHLRLYGVVELDHPPLEQAVRALDRLPYVNRSRPT
jgi:glutathione S-transferase